ncbi:MAG TPA: hypothetical protein PKC91_09730 [Ignavibacteria bacterium]|nr:hypothetical protein [Ignavibacteria bacterium]
MNSEPDHTDISEVSGDINDKRDFPENGKASLFKKPESFLSEHRTAILIFSLLLAALFSLLLFDVKMSTSNDDSMYIESAYNFAEDFQNFPAVNAPLYPIFLSIPIMIFGLNIILLKCINVIFIFLNILFLFLAFRNRVPETVLFIVLITTALNSYFLYFASQTFSEAMALALQSLFLLSAFNVYDKVNLNIPFKKSTGDWLLLGLIMFLFALTRNAAILAVPSLILFFLLNKKYAAAVLSLLTFLIYKLPYEFFRNIFWSAKDQYSGQLDILLLKDPYNPLMGKEDLIGFLTRFYQNADLYISKRLIQILGFKSPDSTEVERMIVYLFLILSVISLIFIIRKKNKYLQLTAVYTGALITETFFILQTQWDQPRLILVYVPLILLILLSGFYYLLESRPRIFQAAFIVILITVFAGSAVTSVEKAKNNLPVLKENLAGDKYSGYNPDWINYLKLSEWCADNLPPNSFVAVRKAPMSFIYAKGKRFYPVYNVFSSDPDTVLSVLKKNNVTHIMIASLRSNNKKNDGSIINTMQRLMYPVSQKYPEKLKLIHTIGDSEPATLFEIDY